MSEPYENRLSLEELRREVRRAWNEERALRDALVDLPDIPPREVLWRLSSAAMNIHNLDCLAIGKREQWKRSLDEIPPKCELEAAAGLWVIIRDALRAATSPKVSVGEG